MLSFTRIKYDGMIETVNGLKQYSLDTVDSTLTYAIDLLNNGERNFFVIAKQQTSGYGTNGRSWISPAGNLYMSFTVSFFGNDVQILSYITCCAAHKIIYKICPLANVKIKPPNDILIDNKKISGILIERFDNDTFVIGIGVNIETPPIQRSVCLKEICPQAIDIVKLAKNIINEFYSCQKQDERLLKQYYYKFLY